MRSLSILFMGTAILSGGAAHANHYPLLCVEEERMEQILCPVSVKNEAVKACECPDGMTPFQFDPGPGSPLNGGPDAPPRPQKASGS